MKIQLIDSRPGVMKSIVLKEWMRIALSICLLGLPVILGYFSIQIVEARNTEIAKDLPPPALGSEFDLSRTTGIEREKAHRIQTVPAGHSGRESRVVAGPSSIANTALEISGSTRYVPSTQDSGNITQEQTPPAFVRHGDMLAAGQLDSGFARAYLELSGSFSLHKNGRLIDPASYIHSTIR
jgi:hypothetical protein